MAWRNMDMPCPSITVPFIWAKSGIPSIGDGNVLGCCGVWKLRQDKTGLQNAFILLKCTQKTHDDCRRIRDALVDNSSGYVQEAYTTNAKISNVRWCVAASALVPVEESEKFKRHIGRLQTAGRNSVGVENLKFVMNEL